MKILEVIIFLLVVLVLGTFEFSNLQKGLFVIMEFGNKYSGALSVLNSLVLAYVTWQYVRAGEKTLEFMKKSFEKEYEEDIKFMFIKEKADRIKEEFVTNEELLLGTAKDDEQLLTVDEDDTYLYINVFNSGRRLVSHVQLAYRVDIINPQDDSVYKRHNIKSVIQTTIQPNDYISFPLVYVGNLPQVEIAIESLRSFNGLGQEQLLNSPKRILKYKNINLMSP